MSVTVAIPSYNSSRYLKDAILSVLNQTSTVDEILIVDDCSTDDSYEIAFEASNQNSNIKVFKNEINVGYSKNWNNCLRYSKSEFAILLHSDDLLKMETIEKQIEYFKENPETAIVAGQEDTIDENGQRIITKQRVDTRVYYPGEIYEFVKERGAYIPCSSVMFNMPIIHKVGYFQENVLATDELYWPKVLQSYPITILGESLIYRRRHGGQAEYSDLKNKKREIVGWSIHFKKILDYELREDKQKDLAQLIKRKLAYSTALNISLSAIRYHSSLALAFYYVFHGIKIYPTMIAQKIFWRKMLQLSLTYFGLRR
jgi:glycosyltransferase involved in cell wall biosynthesis